MKPRREITLGEMQDECIFRGGNCQTISCATVGGDMCVHYKICGKIGKPIDWDLTDPPRFTDAQMALLKALWENGAKKIKVCGMGIVALNEKGLTIYLADILREIEGETLDLAELFGKNDAFLMLRWEINGEENIRRVSKDELPRLLESPYFISVGCYHKYPNMIYGEVGIFKRKIIVVCMGGEQK